MPYICGTQLMEQMYINTIMKLMVTFIGLIVSIIINCLLFWKKDKKYLKIVVLIIFIINIILLRLNFVLFEDDIDGYIAFNLLLSFLLSITFEDVKTKLMDTRVIVGYFVAFLIYRIHFFDMAIFLEGFIGFILSLIIMLIGYFIKRNGVGIGDIEVIAACGMIIGFPSIFHFLFKTFLFVFIAGVVLMIIKKKKLFTEIPLAPFLLLAVIL